MGASRTQLLGEVQYETQSYEKFPLLCPRCSAPMTLVAFITDPDVITRILDHLGEPSCPPEPAPARSPPQVEFEWEVELVDGTENLDNLDQTCWP